MASIDIDKQKILDELKKIDYNEIVESLKKLKKEWDWNPFDKDGDEYTTAWSEFKHNIELLSDLFERVVIAVEKIAPTVLDIASGGAKLEATVQFLDEVVQLPFYLEWADAPVFRLLISLIVDKLNDKYGHDWAKAGLV